MPEPAFTEQYAVTEESRRTLNAEPSFNLPNRQYIPKGYY